MSTTRVPSGVPVSAKNVPHPTAEIPHGGLPSASGGGGVYGGSPPPVGADALAGGVPDVATIGNVVVADCDELAAVFLDEDPHDATSTANAPTITAVTSILRNSPATLAPLTTSDITLAMDSAPSLRLQVIHSRHRRVFRARRG